MESLPETLRNASNSKFRNSETLENRNSDFRIRQRLSRHFVRAKHFVRSESCGNMSMSFENARNEKLFEKLKGSHFVRPICLYCLVALLFSDPSSCLFPWTGIPAVRQEAVIICAGHGCLGVALVM